MMHAKLSKPLRLISEPSITEDEPGFCGECEARKMQLEHVKMLLNAALLAANKPIQRPQKGKR